jgi:hypothetical protein
MLEPSRFNLLKESFARFLSRDAAVIAALTLLVVGVGFESWSYLSALSRLP